MLSDHVAEGLLALRAIETAASQERDRLKEPLISGEAGILWDQGGETILRIQKNPTLSADEAAALWARIKRTPTAASSLAQVTKVVRAEVPDFSATTIAKLRKSDDPADKRVVALYDEVVGAKAKPAPELQVKPSVSRVEGSAALLRQAVEAAWPAGVPA